MNAAQVSGWNTYTTESMWPPLYSADYITNALNSAMAPAPDLALVGVSVTSDLLDPNMTVTITYKSPLGLAAAEAALHDVASQAMGEDVQLGSTTLGAAGTLANELGAVAKSLSGVGSNIGSGLSDSLSTVKWAAIAATVIGIVWLWRKG